MRNKKSNDAMLLPCHTPTEHDMSDLSFLSRVNFKEKSQDLAQSWDSMASALLLGSKCVRFASLQVLDAKSQNLSVKMKANRGVALKASHNKHSNGTKSKSLYCFSPSCFLSVAEYYAVT